MAQSSELIECVICNEVLLDPRALPCGHSYCGPPRACLSCMEMREGGLRCAICRVDHNLKAEDIKPLYGIREYIENGSKLKTSERTLLPCSLHENKNCSLWCNNCEIMMCDDCFDEHDGHLVRKLKKYLVEKIESELGKSLDAGFEEYRRDINHIIDSKMKTLEALKSRVTENEKELDSILVQKELIDEYYELGKIESPENLASELALLLKISDGNLQDLKVFQFADELESRIPEKSEIPKSSVSVSTQADVSASDLLPKLNSKPDPAGNCECGYKHDKFSAVDKPFGVIQLLHVVKKSPLQLGPASDFICCPFRFSLKADVINDYEFQCGKKLEIIVDCCHTFGGAIPSFSLKYKLGILNFNGRCKSFWQEGKWRYPGERRILWRIGVPCSDLVSKAKGWVREYKGDSCLTIALRLMPSVD